MGSKDDFLSAQPASADKTVIVGKHYPAIDGMRGFACAMVLWFHSSFFSYVINQDVPTIYYGFSMLGQAGVDVFFVLSGFLITGILMDTAHDKDVIKKFYIRRSLRIFPLYYGVLFVFAVCLLISSQGDMLKDIVTYVFYLQNFSLEHRLDVFQYLNHTWSLAVEEQFYLVWPILFISVYKKSVKSAIMLCIGMFLLSVLLRFTLMEMGRGKIAYTLVLSHLDGLAIGACLSLLFHYHRDMLCKYIPVIKVLTVFLCGVAILGFFVSSDLSSLIIGTQTLLMSLLFGCILALMILGKESSIFNKFFSLAFLRHIGKISYGLYVFHSPIMNFMGYRLYEYQLGYWSNHLLLLCIGGGVAYIMSLISFYAFEKPILKLKYKWAPN